MKYILLELNNLIGWFECTMVQKINPLPNRFGVGEQRGQ